MHPEFRQVRGQIERLPPSSRYRCSVLNHCEVPAPLKDSWARLQGGARFASIARSVTTASAQRPSPGELPEARLGGILFSPRTLHTIGVLTFNSKGFSYGRCEVFRQAPAALSQLPLQRKTPSLSKICNDEANQFTQTTTERGALACA